MNTTVREGNEFMTSIYGDPQQPLPADIENMLGAFGAEHAGRNNAILDLVAVALRSHEAGQLRTVADLPDGLHLNDNGDLYHKAPNVANTATITPNVAGNEVSAKTGKLPDNFGAKLVLLREQYINSNSQRSTNPHMTNLIDQARVAVARDDRSVHAITQYEELHQDILGALDEHKEILDAVPDVYKTGEEGRRARDNENRRGQRKEELAVNPEDVHVAADAHHEFQQEAPHVQEQVSANADNFLHDMGQIFQSKEETQHAVKVELLLKAMERFSRTNSKITGLAIDEPKFQSFLGKSRESMLKDPAKFDELKAKFDQHKKENAPSGLGRAKLALNKAKGAVGTVAGVALMMGASAILSEISPIVGQFTSPMISAFLMSKMTGQSLKESMMYSYGFAGMNSMMNPMMRQAGATAGAEVG